MQRMSPYPFCFFGVCYTIHSTETDIKTMQSFYPSPIIFQVGAFVLRWYGVLIVGGALLGTWVAAREAKRRGENPDNIWNLFMYALLGGIVGARLYHVISTPAGVGQGGLSYYFGTGAWTSIVLLGQSLPFPRALAVWEGGLGIYGGVIGGILVLWAYTRYYKLSLPVYLDLGALALLVGQIIGRWGNYFNQELYGQPTTLPWGIPIAAAHRLPIYRDLPPETLFHPAFLYESLLNLVAFIILYTIHRRYATRLPAGDIAAGYLISYGTVRFIVEFFRPDAWQLGALPTAQWIGIAAVVAGVVWLVWNHRRRATPRPLRHARRTQ